MYSLYNTYRVLIMFVEGKKRVVVDDECVITVNTADAGQGNITCRIRTPTDTDADIDIVDNNDGTVSIFYTPHTPGICLPVQLYMSLMSICALSHSTVTLYTHITHFDVYCR